MYDEIELSSIKKGDIFYEIEYGSCDEYEALEDAHKGCGETAHGTVCNAKNVRDGTEIEFFQCPEGHAYGPFLYTKKD